MASKPSAAELVDSMWYRFKWVKMEQRLCRELLFLLLSKVDVSSRSSTIPISELSTVFSRYWEPCEWTENEPVTDFEGLVAFYLNSFYVETSHAAPPLWVTSNYRFSEKETVVFEMHPKFLSFWGNLPNTSFRIIYEEKHLILSIDAGELPEYPKPGERIVYNPKNGGQRYRLGQRGRKPKWLVEWLTSGKSIHELPDMPEDVMRIPD